MPSASRLLIKKEEPLRREGCGGAEITEKQERKGAANRSLRRLFTENGAFAGRNYAAALKIRKSEDIIGSYVEQTA